ncbi:hypothetical protein STAFG_6710 [Streptomyces afghaniensis 772]|uniref:Uncharacterized protein n=1 Tax=Streptomyces afghaniensis 772 TaxID=1283301 RepID=S4MRP2_9ACTN|nr:hypothetical protein STAFG_6710 [Streptomyces afghaniensis 772]
MTVAFIKKVRNTLIPSGGVPACSRGLANTLCRHRY